MDIMNETVAERSGSFNSGRMSMDSNIGCDSTSSQQFLRISPQVSAVGASDKRASFAPGTTQRASFAVDITGSTGLHARDQLRSPPELSDRRRSDGGNLKR